MKFKDRLKDRMVTSIVGIRESGRRFPISLLISTALLVVRIYIREMDLAANYDLFESLSRLAMVLGLGIPLSLTIGLAGERFFGNNKVKQIIGQGLGLVFLVFYYYVLLKEINSLSIVRYIGVFLFLTISFFYIGRIKINGDYEKYVINLFSNIFLTLIYSLVLLLGIFMILFTIDQLFDVNMDGKYYYYVFLFVSLIFSLAFLISKLAQPFEDFREFEYRKSLSVLLSYIVIPLISIYSLILYIYFGKIIIQWNWPKGLVSHLVLWYSALSVGVIFLITPIVEENKISRNFKAYFPKLILPILLMMFISIGQRIKQYGLTENRYYILVLGLWVTAMMIFFLSKIKNKNIIIPISLSLLVLNSAFGPLSSMSLSKYSQNKRLKNILANSGMLEGKQIIARSDIDGKKKEEINSIVRYFKNNHSLDDVKLLEEGFTTDKMDLVFGFPYDEFASDYGDPVDNFYYSRRDSHGLVSISGYDFFLGFESYRDSLKYEKDHIEIVYKGNGILEIYLEDSLAVSRDLRDIIGDIHEKYKDIEDGAGEKTLEEMTYEFQEEGLKIKLIFNEISGRIVDSGNPTIDYVNYILLLKEMEN